MAASSHNFFATHEDILALLRDVETSCLLEYAECGLFDEFERSIFRGFSSLPGLGVAKTGESVREPTFLVMFQGHKLTVRTVPQRRGGAKYAIDQEGNPGTVAIRPAGLYNDSVLIAGMVGTVHHDENAIKLIRLFSTALKRDFKKIKSYLVGPEAKKLHDSGLRLTHNVRAPASLNLSE